MGVARLGAVVGGVVAILGGAALLAPAHAAQAVGRTAAPYQGGDHSTYQSCAPHQLAPSCTATSSATPHDGVLAVAASVDSGAGGNLPGAVLSQATAALTPTVDMGRATAATFTVHMRVLDFHATQQNMGRSYVALLATASCDRCPVAAEPYAYPAGPGEQTVSFTLVRGTAGGRMATVRAIATASGAVGCDDFCMLPMGTAAAAARVLVTGIDVKLWGLGSPLTPAIGAPAVGSVVQPSTYESGCDTVCQPFTGERIEGTAEPGMPVAVRDGAGTVGQVITDDTGHWAIDANLPAGQHTVAATAQGPGGTATSPAHPFSVR